VLTVLLSSSEFQGTILAQSPQDTARASVAMALSLNPEKPQQVYPFLLPNVTFKTRELITEHLSKDSTGLISMDMTIDTSKSPKQKTRELIPKPIPLGQLTISSLNPELNKVLEKPGLEITIDLSLPLFTVKPWPTWLTMPKMVSKSLDTLEEKGNLKEQDRKELEVFFEALKRDSRIKIRHNLDTTVTIGIINEGKAKKLRTKTSKNLFLSILKHTQDAFSEVLKEQGKES
jgi:hypothetical protein